MRGHRCTKGGPGGERGRGALHVPPIKIFEKLPHKNAIKHDPPQWSHFKENAQLQ